MKARKLAAVVAAVTMTAGLAACGGSDGGSGSDRTLTFWHHSTTGEGKAYWAQVAADFEKANPGAMITVQAIQNEEMVGKLQTALGSGDGPDVFLARGGGKLADVVAAGQVLDITSSIDAETESAVAEGTFSALSGDGKIYGMPTSVLPGVYCSKDLFKQAGITSTPTSIEALNAAVTKLRAAGSSPSPWGRRTPGRPPTGATSSRCASAPRTR